MPIALGKATRIVQTLLKAGKEYVCLMHLHKDVSEKELTETVKKFTGKINQLPPVKSAVKRQLREREIYYFNILEIQDRDVLFKIGCQAGTYIRKVCTDFGLSLDIGANMQQLIRTKAGPFTDKTWISLHDLKDSYELYKKENNEEQIRKCILPIETAVKHLPKIYVLDSTVDTLCHGADLNIPGISKLDSGIKENDTVAILTLKNELVALGDSLITSQEILEKNQGSAVKTKKVFMSADIYPKFRR